MRALGWIIIYIFVIVLIVKKGERFFK